MKGYFIAPNNVFNLEVTMFELVTLLFLYRCQNNSEAFPSLKAISKNCKMSYSSVVRTIKSLETKSFIEVERHHRKANRYRVSRGYS